MALGPFGVPIGGCAIAPAFASCSHSCVPSAEPRRASDPNARRSASGRSTRLPGFSAKSGVHWTSPTIEAATPPVAHLS